jgi:exopolyphosphatase/guanosine-5'-triphosphate,3'-diphosphate pyrophosphatase
VGFTDPEIELIALIARYHRKSAPKPSHAEFMRLSAPDQQMVRVLSGLLRIAIGLDRSHDGRVEAVTVTTRPKRLTIEVHARHDADIELELYAATERTPLLADALAVPIDLRPV